MPPSYTRAQVGLDKIPPFGLTDTHRCKLLAVRLQTRTGEFIHLMNSDVDRIEVALRTLFSIDHIFPENDDARASLIAKVEKRIKSIDKARKHLHGLISLFHEMEDTQISELAIHLHMMDRENDNEGDHFELGFDRSRIHERYRTIKAIARNPSWFDKAIAGLKVTLNHKRQDRWLNTTLDDLCEVLRDHDVVLARNPHSAPFGLVMDALTLVRPSITTAQIDSYLQITRQGVGKFGFGRRWGEIEDDLPKTEIDDS